MRHVTAVSVPGPGRVVAGAGAVLRTIDRLLAPHGQELRLFPSTKSRATVGGFVAGGSGGVGSVRWGMLRDPGNILRLRVMTMEAQPRVLDLAGANHARANGSHDPVAADGAVWVVTDETNGKLVRLAAAN